MYVCLCVSCRYDLEAMNGTTRPSHVTRDRDVHVNSNINKQTEVHIQKSDGPTRTE